MMFCQNFGAALFLSIAETIFSNTLSTQIPIHAPGQDVQEVINAGAASFRSVVSPTLLPGVLIAYDLALHGVFFLTTGLAVATFIVCWGMGWKSVKKAEIIEHGQV